MYDAVLLFALWVFKLLWNLGESDSTFKQKQKQFYNLKIQCNGNCNC